MKLRDGDVIISKKSRSQKLNFIEQLVLNISNPRFQVYGPCAYGFSFNSRKYSNLHNLRKFYWASLSSKILRIVSQLFLSSKIDWYMCFNNNNNKYMKFNIETRKIILLQNIKKKYR